MLNFLLVKKSTSTNIEQNNMPKIKSKKHIAH